MCGLVMNIAPYLFLNLGLEVSEWVQYNVVVKMDHLQKSWILCKVIRAKVFIESGEIAVHRAQGSKDLRGQVYTDRALERTLNVKCRCTLL